MKYLYHRMGFPGQTEALRGANSMVRERLRLPGRQLKPSETHTERIDAVGFQVTRLSLHLNPIICFPAKHGCSLVGILNIEVVTVQLPHFGGGSGG